MATRRVRSSQQGRSLGTARSSEQTPRAQKPSTRYLIDNSVWARLSTDHKVALALKSIVNLTRPDDVLICAPIALEFGFSARSGLDHSRLLDQLAAFPQCLEHPSTDEALSIQNRLWNGGLLRAAGAMDTLIAAYALKNDAVLVHYDQDFEHIASVIPDFQHQWIVPRGSVS